jgi:hypothetical protein
LNVLLAHAPAHGEATTMLLRQLLAVTDHRKRMALLTFLTFACMC